jgi:hypothetical protein
MRRNKKGQSMVEYALGIGCIAAVCMLAFQGLGLTSADIVRQVIMNVNDKDDQQYANADPGQSPLVNTLSGNSNTTGMPWQPQ